MYRQYFCIYGNRLPTTDLDGACRMQGHLKFHAVLSHWLLMFVNQAKAHRTLVQVGKICGGSYVTNWPQVRWISFIPIWWVIRRGVMMFYQSILAPPSYPNYATFWLSGSSSMYSSSKIQECSIMQDRIWQSCASTRKLQHRTSNTRCIHIWK